MKQIQEGVSYIERTGISSNSVAIDAENVGFITSLLTTKLYSKPLTAFFREIVSNGYDAQKEAKTDEPLIITLQEKKDRSIGVSIRDFGTGISPERFNEIFLFLGSSTKRESNEYIGQLGVGRFSTLAVSDIVHMTSYYNNRIYYYAMYRTEQSICIDKIYEEDSQCKNGFEVEVDIPYKYGLENDIYNAINELYFFDGVYINDINVDPQRASKFNERKIFRNELYAMGHDLHISSTRILYGNVIYNVGSEVRDLLVQYFGTDDIRLFLYFDIGELDVNPNRESLLYNSRTLNAIEQKIKKLYEHIYEILKQQSYSCSNFCEALRLYQQRNIIVDLSTFDGAPDDISVSRGNFSSLPRRLNINNIELSNEILQYMCDNESEYFINTDCFIHEMYNTQFRSHFSFIYKDKACIYRMSRIKNNTCTKQESSYDNDFIIVFHNGNLTEIEKKWWRSCGNKYNHVLFVDPSLLRKSLLKTIRCAKEPKYIIQILRILKTFQFETFSLSDVPESFIKESKKKYVAKAKLKTSDTDNSEKYVHVVEGISSYGNLTFEYNMRSLDELSKMKETIIYSELKDPLMVDLYNAYNCLRRNNYKIKFVTIRKSMLDKIAKLNNTISCADVLYTYNNIMKILAKRFYMSNYKFCVYNNLNKYSGFKDKWFPEYYSTIPASIVKSMEKYAPLFNEVNTNRQNMNTIVDYLDKMSYFTAEVKLYLLHELGKIKLPLNDFKKIKQSILEQVEK